VVDELWMHSFDPQLKWQWCATGVPKRRQGKKNCAVQSRMSCSWPKFDLWLTIPCQLVKWSMTNITAHSCRIRWGQLFTVNNQTGLSMVSFCFRTVQHLIAIGNAKSGAMLELRCSYILPPLQILHWLLVVCTCERSFGGKWFESDDNMNSAVSASLHCLCKNEYRDHLTHRRWKCVDSAGDYIEWRTFV
jgi:hypothetical protein